MGIPMKPRRLGAFMVAIALLAGAAHPAHAKMIAWPDDATSRLEAMALLETMNADFLSTRSATLTLESWCAAHRLSGDQPAKIHAQLVRGVDKPPTLEQRQRLGVGPGERINFRHVLLTCGGKVLSEADNWYVPGRLTPAMNNALETTDIPFGKAVLALGFYRQNIDAKLLWHPLPEGWETRPLPTSAKGATLVIPATLFEHRAILYTRDRTPFSEVHEVYQAAMLDFTPPR